MKPYINESFHNREKIIYLNKAGRELIGSVKEARKTSIIEHDLLRNEVYLHFNCPADWQTECKIEIEVAVVPTLEMKINGIKPVNKKRVISDAVFVRNGYVHLIEIDNTRKMLDNSKKIKMYEEVMPSLNSGVPILYFFTTTEDRKRKLEYWCKGKGFRYEVKSFAEIN
ncbi:hypothetical protein WKH57_25885 [Niallia taxi]|uniref:hypothetical protein n=1 Tax=Niallia taxi TaxID=2499688 RepID=UPI00316BFFDA